MLDRACGQAGFAPAVDYASDDYTVIVALVAAGLGVALIPRLATEALSTEVQLRPVVEPALTRTVSLITHAGRTTHPTIAALTGFLRSTLEP